LAPNPESGDKRNSTCRGGRERWLQAISGYQRR
jgi:hypothetical protein